MKRILSLLMTALMLTICVAPAGAATIDTSRILRVGLFYNNSALPEAKLENVDTAGYTLGYYSDMSFVPVEKISQSQLTITQSGDVFQVADTANGTVLYKTNAAADNLAIHPNSELTWCKGFKWYGDFVYRKAANGKLTVLNYVGLEDYVKGVLPYEMSSDWPIEALKAQAVCARSFALGTLTKHAADGFDLCNTTNCQVYQGANRASANSDRAVDETKGQYLTYNGELVVGYFFSSDGGATEDAVNVWGGDYPYLKGKADPYEDVSSALNGKWSVTLTAEQIQDKLTAAGHSIGSVANVEVTKRTATDNVNEVTVTDTTGKQVKISRDAVRTTFGLNSIRYTITPNTMQSEGSHMTRSNKIGVSTHKITVDNALVSPRGYNVEGNNYFKLRDLAFILNGKADQFNVTWDAANNRILITTKTPYKAVEGDMDASVSAEIKSFVPSDSNIVLDGKPVSLSGYRINGNNYYKVRDVAAAIGFSIDYDEQTETVRIMSNSPVPPSDTPVGAASYTFQGTGWGHSVGMSQYGALAMAKKGYTYEEILKFYFTGISVKK